PRPPLGRLNLRDPKPDAPAVRQPISPPVEVQKPAHRLIEHIQIYRATIYKAMRKRHEEAVSCMRFYRISHWAGISSPGFSATFTTLPAALPVLRFIAPGIKQPVKRLHDVSAMIRRQPFGAECRQPWAEFRRVIRRHCGCRGSVAGRPFQSGGMAPVLIAKDGVPVRFPYQMQYFAHRDRCHRHVGAPAGLAALLVAIRSRPLEDQGDSAVADLTADPFTADSDHASGWHLFAPAGIVSQFSAARCGLDAETVQRVGQCAQAIRGHRFAIAKGGCGTGIKAQNDLYQTALAQEIAQHPADLTIAAQVAEISP